MFMTPATKMHDVSHAAIRFLDALERLDFDALEHCFASNVDR